MGDKSLKGLWTAAQGGEAPLDRIRRIMVTFVFPLILFLFPLLKVNQGIDLTDTGYSLGNYRFFPSMDGIWTMATYLSNVLGYLFTLLPFGDTMIGMKLYSSFLVSFMALVSYRFFGTKMQKTIAFLGEMAAIGLCWCPTVILYNYMTYLLLLAGVILLFRGLAGQRPLCLVLAGVCLGLNVFVRVPNVLQASLILSVWYYGLVRGKTFKKVAGETLLCLAGYLGAIGGMLLVLIFIYGGSAYASMLKGLFGMAGAASDYTPFQMLGAIFDAYWHGFKWLLYMILCLIPGIPFFLLGRGKWMRARKILYCLCILFLFLVLGRWGMYNFRYYQKEAALQWAVVFLLVSMAVLLSMMISQQVDWHWKLLASLAFLVILITPIGSNNHVWPVINNMFFIAPVVLWVIYKYARWGRQYIQSGFGRLPSFPLKAMGVAVSLAFIIQSVGIGVFYVFLDGEQGERRTAKIRFNAVAAGMYTTQENAEALEELSRYVEDRKEKGAVSHVILYGNIPALAYYLDLPPAIFNAWPDLDTNTLEQLEYDIALLIKEVKEGREKKPVVILTPDLAAWQAGDEEGMEWFGTDKDRCAEDKKLEAITGFLHGLDYKVGFSNHKYVLYE